MINVMILIMCNVMKILICVIMWNNNVMIIMK